MKEITLANKFRSADRYKGGSISLRSKLLELCRDTDASFVGQIWYERRGIQRLQGTLEIKENEWRKLFSTIDDDNVIAFHSDLIERNGDTYYLAINMEEKVRKQDSVEKKEGFLFRHGHVYQVPGFP